MNSIFEKGNLNLVNTHVIIVNYYAVPQYLCFVSTNSSNGHSVYTFNPIRKFFIGSSKVQGVRLLRARGKLPVFAHFIKKEVNELRSMYTENATTRRK